MSLLKRTSYPYWTTVLDLRCPQLVTPLHNFGSSAVRHLQDDLVYTLSGRRALHSSVFGQLLTPRAIVLRQTIIIYASSRIFHCWPIHPWRSASCLRILKTRSASIYLKTNLFRRGWAWGASE